MFFLRSKFLEYGNGILAAIVLVTCPCDLLYEQLQNIVHRSSSLLPKLNWLNIIRPDWFDMNYEIRSQVQTYLIIKNLIETREINFSIDKLMKIVIENAELDSYRTVIIHLIMHNEQWELINLLVKHEHDWIFLNTQTTKVKYLKNFLSKIFYLSIVTRLVIYNDGILERIFC